MKVLSKLAAVVGGLALAAAGAVAAQADTVTLSLSQTTLMPGQPFTAKLAGCDGQARVSLGDNEGKVVSASNISLVAPLKSGAHKITATCLTNNAYDDDNNLNQNSDTATVNVTQDRVAFSPSSWKAGQAVTLSAFGFEPGETVKLRMVNKKSGKQVWAKTLGTAKANGFFSQAVVLKSDVPQGDYYLYLEGAKRKVVGQFYWGQPDTNDPSSKPSDNGTDKGTGGGSNDSDPKKRPGLPATGV